MAISEQSVDERQAGVVEPLVRGRALLRAAEEALADEDLVTVHSQWVSFRMLLHRLQNAHKQDRSRYFCLGLVHDTLVFTDLMRVTPAMLAELSRAFTHALADQANPAEVRSILGKAGLDLSPQ